jgi:purine-nucleoside phosphorylase
MGLTILQQIEETVKAIRSVYKEQPRVGIVLGSGLGNLTSEITVEQELSYTEIPHFPVSTVEGHQGKLIFGLISGQRVVILSGRLHYY